MKVLNTTKCPKCGNEPKITSGFLEIQAEKGFLGGKPVKFMDAACECGEKYIAVMQPAGNNYILKTLAEQELPFEPAEVRDLSKMERKELIALAKLLEIKGKISTMKSTELIALIQEKQG